MPLVLGLLVWGPPGAFSILVALAAAGALHEFLSMMATAGWRVPVVAPHLVVIGAVTASHFRSPAGLAAVAAAAVLLCPSLVLFTRGTPEPVLLPSSAGGAFAALYVSAGAAGVVALRGLGWKPVLLLLAVVWAGDSAAYYTGRRWGKRRLAPVVSPKKSWEGFWGQLVGGAASAGAWAALTGAPPSGLAVSVLLGVFLSAAAVVGDLVESTFKRSLSVKDSGSLLPGHGGLLDRLDSLLYAAPFAWASFYLLPGVLPR